MAVRPQLHHETVPERQARPKAENDLQRPLAERIVAALKIFPLCGVALPFTLQMVLSMFPLTNLNTRHQRRRQQLHRRRNLLPLQLLSLVP